MVVGIICEYNPLHLGHLSQMQRIREHFGEETAIVCAMSGNFVQRGAPAIMEKSLRAKAAVLCGADLVVELPVTTALSSAEGFARGGVAVLSPLCDVLCFGTETASPDALMEAAQALLSEAFPPLLRQELDRGTSFPTARAAALKAMGSESAILSQPNDILGVEYCKAILSQGSGMEIYPISRPGNYHAALPDPQAPSATALRTMRLRGEDWSPFIPAPARTVFESAVLHNTAAGERAMLARLRTLSDEEFESLPYGSEGLWRKFMGACRREANLEAILTATKSKRYTRSRLDRMAMCAFLGLTARDLAETSPYVRVLAFSDRGRSVLNRAKKYGVYINAGERFLHPFWELERRCDDLYGLFALTAPQPPGAQERCRVFYKKPHKENPNC